MQKQFIVGLKYQWTSNSIDLIKIGFHKCEHCDLFMIAICGIGIDIGFTTLE